MPTTPSPYVVLLVSCGTDSKHDNMKLFLLLFRFQVCKVVTFLDFVFGAYYISRKRWFQETYDSLSNLHNFYFIFVGYHVGPTSPLSGAHFEHLTFLSTSSLDPIAMGPQPTYEAPTDMATHKTTLSPWILQRDCHNFRCTCLANLRPNIVYIQGIPYEQPSPLGLRSVTYV